MPGSPAGTRRKSGASPPMNRQQSNLLGATAEVKMERSPKKGHCDVIDEYTMHQIYDELDKDHDGKVSKDEYRIPYKKLFPKCTDEEFDKVWAKMDSNGDGVLQFNELASHYGFKLDAKSLKAGPEGGGQNMNDDQIMEALQMQAALAELAEEQEEKKRQRAAQAAQAAKEGRGSRHTSAGRMNTIEAAAEVTSIKMPTRIMLSAQADPEVLFLQACELGDYDDVKKGLDDGVNVMIEGHEKGEMAPHKLARHGNVAMVRAVLDHTGNSRAATLMMNWQCKKGKTPLHFAAEYNQAELVSFLLGRGADYSLVNVEGQNCLHGAVNAQALDVVRALLSDPKVEKEKILDTPDKQNRTPLHLASFKQNENLTKILLEFGANRDLKDTCGLAPVDLAAKTGRRKSKELLEAAPAGGMARTSTATGGA